MSTTEDKRRELAELEAELAALTHLVLGWAMVLVYPLGGYVTHPGLTEQP